METLIGWRVDGKLIRNSFYTNIWTAMKPYRANDTHIWTAMKPYRANDTHIWMRNSIFRTLNMTIIDY